MLDFIDLEDYLIKMYLPNLLKDKDRNIVFATDSYVHLGSAYNSDMEISVPLLKAMNLKPRFFKSKKEQTSRTRKKAEVSSPAWLCCKMNNFYDEEWFGKPNVFNHMYGNFWEETEAKIVFPKRKSWKKYIRSTQTEITCGEAPFIVSRYDSAEGFPISIEKRIGILDRKLRVVNENTTNIDDWFTWTSEAFKSVHGYEIQGDSLLIARINLLMTFIEYYKKRWKYNSKDEKLHKKISEITNIIAKNFYQVDGLTGKKPPHKELQLFLPGIDIQNKERIMKNMKFDFVIGNPPYQDETVGEQKSFAPPVYDKFMDESYKIADIVEFITPARFLFNAGGTSKEWNQKMLNDEHLKILFHEQNSDKVFKGTDIKGGIVITYRNTQKNFGAIKTYTAFPELNSIIKKVKHQSNFQSLSEIISNRGLYKFSKKAYKECPYEMAKNTDSRIGASSFERMPSIFFEEKPNDDNEYVRFFGLLKTKRTYRWLRKDYFNEVINFEKYKVLVPKANGSGALGEVLSTPVIGHPVIGHTETFISIGAFDTETEAQSCYKYICSKFCRAMLGILKITQDNPPEKWAYVPLQDFTSKSDINWSVSVKEIDRQLYQKYGLSNEEINFIETHVKEMS